MVSHPGAPSLIVEPAGSDDLDRIAQLTVDGYVGGGLATPAYGPELLVTTCLDRARAAGKRRMVISTDPLMTTAHRLYERLGFSRLPERDWRPEPGVDLLVYSREL